MENQFGPSDATLFRSRDPKPARPHPSAARPPLLLPPRRRARAPATSCAMSLPPTAMLLRPPRRSNDPLEWSRSATSRACLVGLPPTKYRRREQPLAPLQVTRRFSAYHVPVCVFPYGDADSLSPRTGSPRNSCAPVPLSARVLSQLSADRVEVMRDARRCLGDQLVPPSKVNRGHEPKSPRAKSQELPARLEPLTPPRPQTVPSAPQEPKSPRPSNTTRADARRPSIL